MENKQEEITTTKPARKKISWLGLGSIACAFGLIVLIAVVFVAFNELIRTDHHLAKAIIGLNDNLAELQAKLSNVQTQSQQSSDGLKQAMIELQQLQGDKNSWQVAEAQYYVNLAHTNLQLEGNVSVAIQLLQAADQSIHNANDLKLDGIRKALADDIVKLQSVTKVDYTGLYLRLSALNNELDKLPMLIQHGEALAPTAAEANEVWWKRGLHETWLALQKIVVVRYNAKGVPPLVTPQQHDFLLQNLHGILEKSMWAVLNKQSDIYHASLQQASAWIKQYFLVDAAITQSVLENLNQLQQMDIHPAIPDVDDSLQAFRDYANQH